MESRRSKKEARVVFSTSKREEWATLGEQLRQKYPELVEKFQEFQESDQVVGRLVDVFCDLFPYDWQDRPLFHEGLVLCIRGHHVAAIGIFQRILEDDPDAYLAYHLLGFICGSMGRYKKEIDYYRKAIRLKDSYSQIHLDLAMAHWAVGSSAKAYSAIKRSIFLAYDFSVIDHWLTFQSDNLGRFLDIYGSEEKAQAEKNQFLADAYYLLGNAYIEVGQYQTARTSFKSAVRIDPQHAKAHYQLGVLHVKKLRNPQRAKKYLKKAEDLFVSKGDLQRAQRCQQWAQPQNDIAEKEQIADDWLKEGLNLQNLGRHQSAVDAYKKAIFYKADFLDAYYNMGIAYGSLAEAGRDTIGQAIGALKHAIRLSPGFAHSHVALGASYLKQGSIDDALSVLLEASRLSPDNSLLFYYLGTAFRMKGDLSQAVGHLKRSVDLAPDSVQGHFILGLALLEHGLAAEAQGSFIEALRIKPDLADAHYILGDIYRTQLIDSEKSLFHYKKAHKLFIKLNDFEKAHRIESLLDT